MNNNHQILQESNPTNADNENKSEFRKVAVRTGVGTLAGIIVLGTALSISSTPSDESVKGATPAIVHGVLTIDTKEYDYDQNQYVSHQDVNVRRDPKQIYYNWPTSTFHDPQNIVATLPNGTKLSLDGTEVEIVKTEDRGTWVGFPQGVLPVEKYTQPDDDQTVWIQEAYLRGEIEPKQ